MYNQPLYNVNLYNASSILVAGSASDDDVKFGGFGFYQRGKVIIDQPQYDRPAQLIINKYKNPNSDGFGQNSQYQGIKKIIIRGILKTNNQQELETLIDELNNELNVSFGYLDIKRADGLYRRFKAKPVTTTGLRTKHYHVDWCDFSINFEIYDGMGMDTAPISIGTSINTLKFDGSVNCGTVGKSIRTPADITIVTSAATNITKCNIKNLTSGDEIEFRVSLTAGDFLVVSSTEKECYKMSAGQRTNIKPKGRYITLQQGINNYNITFTGTDISYQKTMKYTNLYI